MIVFRFALALWLIGWFTCLVFGLTLMIGWWLLVLPLITGLLLIKVLLIGWALLPITFIVCYFGCFGFCLWCGDLLVCLSVLILLGFDVSLAGVIFDSRVCWLGSCLVIVSVVNWSCFDFAGYFVCLI